MTMPCSEKDRIDQMHKVLLVGNGKPSITDQLTELNTNLKLFMKRQEDLIIEYGITNLEFHEFRQSVETRELERDRYESRRRWRIGIQTTVIVAIITVTFAWLGRLSDKEKTLSNKINTVQAATEHSSPADTLINFN
jgi:hypothetical protein